MRTVDELIQDVQREDPKKKKVKKHQQTLKSRRENALARIGDAAKKYLSLGNSRESEEVLRRRLEEARDARISLAEAIAALAEQGDFSSRLMWWSIEDKDRILWKGYVIKLPILAEDVMGYSIRIRQQAESGYVAIITGTPGKSVGISDGDDMSPAQAITRAYESYKRTFKNIFSEAFLQETVDALGANNEDNNLLDQDTGGSL